MSSLHGVALRGHWIEVPEALVSGVGHCHLTSAVCICALTSARADLVTDGVWRICMYEVLQ